MRTMMMMVLVFIDDDDVDVEVEDVVDKISLCLVRYLVSVH